MITKKCTVSGQDFMISDKEVKFYESLGVPLPDTSSIERQRLAFTYRNERNLFWRECAATGKKILSMYNPESPATVYDCEYWWGDGWDGMEYGRDFDFSRPFFEQFRELLFAVPHMALEIEKPTMQNSDYCNAAANLKDCYLCFNADYNEKCLYSNYVNGCFKCLDCYQIDRCELCYECCHCDNCYDCSFVLDSANCNNCEFSADLLGCSDCFGCTNLRNKKYYFNNQACKEDEYKQKVQKLKSTHTNQALLELFLSSRQQRPHRHMQQRMTENSTGNHLVQCKDCHNCYDCEKLQNSAHCIGLKGKDSVNYGNYDVCYFGYNVSHCGNCMTIGYDVSHVFGCVNCYEVSNLWYSYFCFQNSQNCFGCVGLKKSQYCILNKQYTKEEYERLVPKIIDHMKQTGEWGSFFPPNVSPFCYNETIAQDYFPLNPSSSQEKGFEWRKQEQNTKYLAQQYIVPENVANVPDEICDKILTCEQSGKNYKIQKAELKFYRQKSLPIPRFCPDVRHAIRIKRQNPRKLYKRQCAVSSEEIWTTYAPERPEKVVSEPEYLKIVD